MNDPDFFCHTEDMGYEDAPLHYRRSGLDNIFLVNGFDRETVDGEEYVTVADVDGLHEAIGIHLVTTRKVLEPKEIRFLRRTLDLTQSEMGRLIGQSDQQIARWEKGGSKISGPADRLLRIMFMSVLENSRSGQSPMEFLNELDGLDTFPEASSVAFRKEGDEWLEKMDG